MEAEASIPLLLFFGTAVGFLITVLGGGGSLLLVPALVYIWKLPVQQAAGTALLAIFASATLGFFGHWRAGRVHLKTACLVGAASMFGAGGGAQLHSLISDRAAMIAFALILFRASFRLSHGDSARDDEAAGSKPTEHTPPLPLPIPILLSIGAGVGVLAGFLGIGGGFLIVPVLISAARIPTRDAIGTGVGVVALSAASGALSHAIDGAITAELALLLTPSAMLGGLIGVPISARIPARRLRQALAALLAVVGSYIVLRQGLNV